MPTTPPPLPLTASPTRTYIVNAVICWTVIIGIVSFMLIRNTLAYQYLAKAASTSPSQASPVTLEITARFAVGENHLLLNGTQKDPATAERLRKQLMAQVDQMALTPAEKLNAVAVAGELDGDSVALDQLEEITSKLPANSDLQHDAEILSTIYDSNPSDVSPKDRQALIDRHGWFGKLALSFGRPETDPLRTQVVGAAVHTTVASTVVGVTILLLLFFGSLLLILGIVLAALGRLRFKFLPMPPQDPPVLLETFALWLAAFTAMGLLIRASSHHAGAAVGEAIGLVLSFAVALWPLRRGWSWPQLRGAMGWHSGEGAAKEIACGLIGYIAGLPVMAVGMLISLLLIARSHLQPMHPIAFELSQGGFWTIIGLYFAACIGAPLLEETMFRGALYHHLRSRLRPWLATTMVSFIFAAIHPQGWTLIPALGSIAVVLATLREWRGTLLTSITAHAMNNAIVLTVLLYLIR
jgi:membrane protease YdiL (CAAX protease family)